MLGFPPADRGRILYRDTGAGWDAHPLAGVSWEASPSVRSDGSGGPHTVYYRGPAGDPSTALVHDWWDGAAWRSEDLAVGLRDGGQAHEAPAPVEGREGPLAAHADTTGGGDFAPAPTSARHRYLPGVATGTPDRLASIRFYKRYAWGLAKAAKAARRRRTWALLAQAQIELGDMASARAALERARELSPDGPFVWHFLGVTSLLEGQPAAALAAFERSPGENFRIMGVALARHGLGQTAAAQEALDALATRFADTEAYQIAAVHAWRSERDAAFEWLERAYRQHDSRLIKVKYDPLLRPLRGDPRYQTLLKKMNLPVD